MTTGLHGILFGANVSTVPGTMQSELEAGAISFLGDGRQVADTTWTHSANATGDVRYDLWVVDSTGVASVLEGWTGTISQLSVAGKMGMWTVGVPDSAANLDSAVLTQNALNVTKTAAEDIATPYLGVSNTLHYSWIPGVNVDADPGPGAVASNTGDTSLTALYVNAFPPIPFGSTYTSVKSWLGELPGRRLKLWSRSSPGVILVVDVTAATSHPNHTTLTVTNPIVTSSDTGPTSSTIPLLSSGLDTVLEDFGPIPKTAGTLISRTVHTSGTSATHTFNTDTASIRMVVVGGGGGGGGAAGGSSGITSQYSAAGGGGAAGGTTDTYVNTFGNTSCTYTVGTGGVGGAAGNNSGASGGTSSLVLGGITYTGAGGTGGHGSAAVTNSSLIVQGGTGGTATNGDINIPGGDGLPAYVVSGTPGPALSGAGGSSEHGVGGIPTGSPANGPAGKAFGGGGAGGNSSGSTGHSGGNGAPGVVIIEEYA